MKIRIKGNHIRFRLGKSEVLRFQQSGELREVISFGPLAGAQLSFVLKQAPGSKFNISFRANTITAEIPQTICAEWTQTGLVGFDEAIDNGAGEPIFLLVQKDFACLDGTDIENADAFPNPNLQC